MNIQQGGHIRTNEKAFPFSCREGLDCYMLHLLRSGGEYRINHSDYSVKPGYGILITPGTPWFFSCPQDCTGDDWICFLPEKGDPLPSHLAYNAPFLPNDFETCSTLIRQLLTEHSASHFTPPLTFCR